MKRKKKKTPEEVIMKYKTMNQAHQWADTHNHSQAFDIWLAEADRREAEINKVLSVWQKIWNALKDEVLRDFGFKG